jgi:2'-5' RNA ligase
MGIQSEGVLDSLVSFQGSLAATGAELKLVERENLHFTVKFLGEISDAQVAEVDRRLRGLRLGGVAISVAGVGAFPTVYSPNVVWVGVSKSDDSKVRTIAEAVIGALGGIGERDERPFQAHITLARVRQGGTRGSLSALIRENSRKVFGEVKLTAFSLKSSILTPRGPVYSDVGVYALT